MIHRPNQLEASDAYLCLMLPAPQDSRWMISGTGVLLRASPGFRALTGSCRDPASPGACVRMISSVPLLCVGQTLCLRACVSVYYVATRGCGFRVRARVGHRLQLTDSQCSRAGASTRPGVHVTVIDVEQSECRQDTLLLHYLAREYRGGGGGQSLGR